MTDADKYKAEQDALWAKIEDQELQRRHIEITEKVGELKRRGLALSPRLTVPEMIKIIDSGHGLNEIESVIWHREHPDD